MVEFCGLAYVAIRLKISHKRRLLRSHKTTSRHASTGRSQLVERCELEGKRVGRDARHASLRPILKSESRLSSCHVFQSKKYD